MSKSALIVGGSAGLGRALAEEAAQVGWDLFLVATDARDLDPLACDLALRFNVDISWRTWDVGLDTAAGLIEEVLNWRKFDAVFLISGFGIPDADDGSLSPEELKRLTAINFTGPAELLTLLLPHMRDRPTNIVVAGSVASARPRSRNLVYGAAKGALMFYCEGLQYGKTGQADLQFYSIGFLDTSMMAEIPTILPKANPKKIARAMLSNLGRSGFFILPMWWHPLLFLFRIIPKGILKKIYGRSNSIRPPASSNERSV